MLAKIEAMAERKFPMNYGQKLKLAALVASLTAAGAANAGTVVATIDGCYDCLFYDTPGLTFHNTSGGTFINAQMILTPYQPGTLTYGLTPQVIPLGTMGGGDTKVIWKDGYGGTVKGDLFSYDYDDSYGNTPSGYTNANCVVGAALCSLVGNFSVTFTATVSGGTFNGDPIFSVFSPTTNQTGGFIGWEGLDPTGLSETIYDQHTTSTSTVNGTLANIELGTPPSPVPEPKSYAVLLGGLGLMMGFVALRWRQKAA